MPGPPPKPAHLRARTNKKATCARLVGEGVHDVPAIPNPDGRRWHSLTLASWEHAWTSPMASQWLEADCDGLGRLALLWDEYYRQPRAQLLAEIRLQEQRFGLSPLDRSRLQWEVKRVEEAETKQPAARPKRVSVADPRALLMSVKP